MRKPARTALGVLLLLTFGAGRTWAHNETVHQEMTALAYQVIVAGASTQPGNGSVTITARLDSLQSGNAAMTELFQAMAVARPKLRGLKSGLKPNSNPCLLNQIPGCVPGHVTTSACDANGVPDWSTGKTKLADVSLGKLRFPVSFWFTDPESSSEAPDQAGSDCGIALPEQSGRVLAVAPSVSALALPSDWTGMALGFWAQWPDKELDDWHVRSTALEVLTSPVLADSLGISVGVAAAVGCSILCALMPIACVLCPEAGYESGQATASSIESVNATDRTDASYVGFGHFNDMKPPYASAFDQPPGKLGDLAGPEGSPDAIELMVTAAADLLGVHINSGTSNGPKHYEIILGSGGQIGSDFHRNSTHRATPQWETATFPHLELTAVDNLAMFGWRSFEATIPKTIPTASGQAKHLGWVLHALGDATVPQHVVGASGYGHRPYEDAVELNWPTVVLGADPQGQAFVEAVLERAVFWRKFILTWRRQPNHPAALAHEVPVRDLIDALARRTFSTALANRSLVFHPELSTMYLFASRSEAVEKYSDMPGLMSINRALLIDGIGAEVAFLVSAMEMVP